MCVVQNLNGSLIEILQLCAHQQSRLKSSSNDACKLHFTEVWFLRQKKNDSVKKPLENNLRTRELDLTFRCS